MSEVLDNIRSNVGQQNLGTSCSRDGCRVYLAGVPSDRIIVDLDKVFPDGKDSHGDYVLFYLDGDKSVLVTVPMELKSGSVDASKAHEQLQQAASHAERLVPANSKPVCHPILFYGGKRLHRVQRDRLNKGKIHFGGRKLTVKTARCGKPGNLEQALRK